MRAAITAVATLVVLSMPRVLLAQDGHEQHDAAIMSEHQHMAAPLPSFIPELTDADREAAFPDVGDHPVHPTSIHAFVLVDQLEWRSSRGESTIDVDAGGWVGGDLSRFWYRTEAASSGGRLDDGRVEGFYGRAVSRWWDVLAGVRQDIGPGPRRTWAAIGLQGLAPQWFEVTATAYVGASGRTLFRGSAEYELLLTNRLVFQPSAAVEVHGKGDVERRIGAGVSHVDAGLRLRYEIRRELAPYIGVAWERKVGRTAGLAREVGQEPHDRSLVMGVRLWF